MKKNYNQCYYSRVRCDNCGVVETIPIERGKTVEEEECSNCGCKALHLSRLF